MTPNGGKSAAGVTLIEVTVTIVVIAVAILGTAAYRYHSALDARKAQVRVAGANLALLLLNAWKSTGGESDYNPTAPDNLALCTELEMYDNAGGASPPSGYSPLAPSSNPNYRIVLDGVNYYATLSYKDQEGDPRLLNVCVAWMNDYQMWTQSSPYQSVNLSTYVID